MVRMGEYLHCYGDDNYDCENQNCMLYAEDRRLQPEPPHEKPVSPMNVPVLLHPATNNQSSSASMKYDSISPLISPVGVFF